MKTNKDLLIQELDGHMRNVEIELAEIQKKVSELEGQKEILFHMKARVMSGSFKLNEVGE